jgi:hypothetical protein
MGGSRYIEISLDHTLSRHSSLVVHLFPEKRKMQQKSDSAECYWLKDFPLRTVRRHEMAQTRPSQAKGMTFAMDENSISNDLDDKLANQTQNFCGYLSAGVHLLWAGRYQIELLLFSVSTLSQIKCQMADPRSSW